MESCLHIFFLFISPQLFLNVTKYEPQFFHGEKRVSQCNFFLPRLRSNNLVAQLWYTFVLYTRYVQELPPCRPSRQTLLSAMVNEPWMIDLSPCVPFSPPPHNLRRPSYYRNRLRLHKHTSFILFCAPKRIRKKSNEHLQHCQGQKILVPHAGKQLTEQNLCN
uniref:Secreted protein n=1 Tax=Rhipicephalus appendiculatus TaxID=34631 RepID=A0A131YD97_RHIAP